MAPETVCACNHQGLAARRRLCRGDGTLANVDDNDQLFALPFYLYPSLPSRAAQICAGHGLDQGDVSRFRLAVAAVDFLFEGNALAGFECFDISRAVSILGRS